MNRSVHGSTLLLAASLLVAACGGGSGGGGRNNGGTATAVTRGAITEQTGTKIRVNGVELEVHGANVRVEKQQAAETELHRGMVVTVKGNFDDRTGTATEVEFEDAVKGKVEGKTADTVQVGGQSVRIDDSTEFEDNTARLGSVATGTRVRVSAVPDDNGGLRATRIERLTGTSDDFEVKGFVSGLSAAGFTLKVSPDSPVALAVTYGAGVTAPAGLANGSYVEVRSAAPPTAGAIVATAVTLEDRYGTLTHVELEGVVTSGTSAQFVIDGQTVQTQGSTRWQFGVPADLVPGVKVEAEGHLDANRVLVADRVSFRSVARLQGTVTNVTADGLRSAHFTLVGLPVTLTDLSDWRDALSPSNIGNTIVELRGNPNRTGTGVTGTRVDAKSDTRLILQGGASAKDAAAGTLQILGITVATNGSTSFHDASDQHLGMTKDAFFAAVEAGRTIVKARGRDAAALSGTTLTAEELELEGDE